MASTRIILLHGDEGTAAAGKVIQSFGQFVVGGNYIVGIVIFLILFALNKMVIVTGTAAPAYKAKGDQIKGDYLGDCGPLGTVTMTVR